MTWRFMLVALCAFGLVSPAVAAVPSGAGDAIFAVGAEGFLEPIAVRRHGAFTAPGPNDGGPSPKLRADSNAAIVAAGNQVNVVFGGRTVATVPATVRSGGATIAVPSSLHLGGYVSALASPTLGGHPGGTRRAPTAAERAAALALAAKAVGGVAPAKLTVRNLTAIDLGHGSAIVGTINLRGSGAKRVDRRLFFVAEHAGGALRTTLANVQTITVTEALLEEAGESLVDAIDLGDGSLSLITNEIGYDARTFAIYHRGASGWKRVYEGGGAAM